MRWILFALAVPLAAQIDPTIPLQAGRGGTPLVSPLVMAEQAMRLRVMQEQSRLMAAQREALQRQAVAENYREGFEAGAKEGYEKCRQVMLDGFKEYLPTLEQQIVANAMRMVFTAQSADELRALLVKAEADLAANPSDYQKKGFAVLLRARLAELEPPPEKVKPKKKKT